ncbi:MAG: DNA-directed RNA polymerase subunit D [Thermoplasmata archaeon]|jgi:DNA-directed RNA polymerase subunit D|nr:DNA-directed RNA polymerase subunit D [Thermoplasmata archaeon]
MKIDILEMTQTRAQFVITDTNPAFANALRRTIVSDIPKMAIDNVEFHLGPIMDEKGTAFESVSPLFDEVVAHRLSLVPVPTDLDAFNFRAKCSCNGEGCPSCTVMYSLNKKGPCTVYSGDLEPIGDAKLRIKDDLIPIVKLAEDQALLVYATAELGTGKQHAKWQAALGAGYRYFAKIHIDQAKCDIGGSCVKVCPKGVLAKEDKKIVVKHPEKCNLCNACVEVCDAGVIKVSGDPTKILFRFETDGSLTAKQVLMRGLKNLEERFEGLREQISTLEE